MEQIMREAVIDTYFVSTGALIVIWTSATLALFKTRTLGYVNKRERHSKHSREKYLPSHDKLNCEICKEEFVCKHDVQPLCECFNDYMCDYHALPKGGA